MYKVLVLHALRPISRQTNIDHVYCYPEHRQGVLYVFHNVNVPPTEGLVHFPFDAVILNYCFLGRRAWPQYRDVRKRFAFLSTWRCVKIAVCQDDYTQNEVLDEWLDSIRAEVIFSPIEHDLDVLYPRCFPRATFRPALTGYSTPGQAAELTALSRRFADRTIDLGTRVRAVSPALGRQGIRKAQTAAAFGEIAAGRGFRVDVSTDPDDVLLGLDWFRFLGNCRYTLAARGGASMCDPRGEIKARVDRFLARFPGAPFDVIEQSCFPGMDGHDFSAISPRLFEAAALRTGLILLEDDYLPGLKPYTHYLPLKQDFSNADEVLALMRDDQHTERMINEAYSFLIASGTFSYRRFVDDVFAEIVAAHPMPNPVSDTELSALAAHFRELAAVEDIYSGPPVVPDALRNIARLARRRDELDDFLASAEGSPADGGSSVMAADLRSAEKREGRVSGLLDLGRAISSAEAERFGQACRAAMALGGEVPRPLDWGYCEYVFDADDVAA